MKATKHEIQLAAIRYMRAAENSVWERNHVDSDYEPARDALQDALGVERFGVGIRVTTSATADPVKP